MKIQFIGATHEVTGSCTLLEVCGKKYLVYCRSGTAARRHPKNWQYWVTPTVWNLAVSTIGREKP